MSNDETDTPNESATDSGATTADTAVEMTKVVESESAVDAEPTAAKDEAIVSWWHGRSATVAARVGVAAVVCASLATSVVMFVQNQHSNNLLRAQEQAREAACHYGPVLADYDSKNLDTYFKAVLDGAVGDWKKQFESTSTELREVLTQGEVTSQVTDTQCAIRTADEDSAEAIVVIRQTITSLGTGHKPKPGQLAMVLSLRNDNGSWLVEKVNSPTPPTQAQ
ncbi:hypothetical protein [Nocardia sp. NPDC058705]|uniref:hypothetical protein n=1 Tax=Nocardia sp. NPDC058705 TaxID=3346609 RepID=UPI0036ADCF02